MPFRLWYYTVKGSFVLFPLILLTILAPTGSVLATVGMVAILGLLVPLGVIGAVLGVLFAMGRLRMRCPFCGNGGQLARGAAGGLALECGQCGVIHGSGPLGLALVADPVDDADTSDDEE